MEFFKKIFKRKREPQQKPQPLRIEGCKTTLTPKPDDAELAAQALLESRIYGDKEQRKAAKRSKQTATVSASGDQPRDAAYYHDLSDRVKAGREAERRDALRFIAYVEENLTSSLFHLPSAERQLYQYQDTVEREGGDLLSRWQKCLAECIIAQMRAADATDLHGLGEEAADETDEHGQKENTATVSDGLSVG